MGCCNEVSRCETPEEKEKNNNYDDYDVEEALRNLKRAEEVKMKPNLMKRVKMKAAHEIKEIKSIQDLKDIANNGSIEEEEEY